MVKSLLAQTLIPAKLTIIHACAAEHGTTELRSAVRNVLGGEESYSKAPEFVTHACEQEMVDCMLAYLTVESQARPSGHIVVLDVASVLEGTALETMWLTLVLRTHVPSVRGLAYMPESLKRERETGDALAVRRVVAANDSVRPLPLMLDVESYRRAVADGFRRGQGPWAPFVDVLARGRVIRRALYTDLDGNGDAMSLEAVDPADLPPHLFSEIASEKWAAQLDENEMYQDPLLHNRDRTEPVLDVSATDFPRVQGKETRVFLVLPWMQMGGSEKCMLDIAERVLDMGWGVTFVLTMPFWQENEIGEIGLYHQWLDKALALTSDTFDLLSLGSHGKSIRAFRHLLESRQPDYLLLANTRWAYANSELIRLLSPKTVVADYNHMIHMSWEGGGMPRYGANNSQWFDLHLTASKNVADAMRGWIRKDIMIASPQKVQPCYIGTDPNLLHTGSAKLKARRRMRQAFNITEEEVVVLFAGRFVIDKGLDVMSEVVTRVAKSEKLSKSLTFVFVGSGEEEHRLKKLIPITRNGPRVFIRPPARGLLELREYYALSDVLLLPSVNEGIALVIYEAMATGVLVIATDVGGQKEVVTPKTGILLPNFRSLSKMTNHTLQKLKEVVNSPESFARIAKAGEESVRGTYTTEKFRTCVVQNLLRAKYARETGDTGMVANSSDTGIVTSFSDTGIVTNTSDTAIVANSSDTAKTDDSVDAEEEGEAEESLLVKGGEDPLENASVTNSDVDAAEEATDIVNLTTTSLPPETSADVEIDSDLIDRLVEGAQTERYHGVWNMNSANRAVENMVTIGIKTYVCDPSIIEQVRALLRSIRVHYPLVRVLLGNDGPIQLGMEPFVSNDPHTEEFVLPRDCGISFGRNFMVNMTTTRYFVLLDDDHLFDDTTNLTVLVDGIRQDQFDMVGMRVRNLPGIDELERTGILIPRYVAMIQKLENRVLTLCVWNENMGPSIFGITHPIPVDVLHNAFIGRTDVLRNHPWRNVLKVNEHMTFFLDAKNASLRVGYLPSVFIHHRSRDYSDCYYKIRFREEKYRKLLPYKDEFAWDMKCQAKFPDKIRSHILKYELDI